MNPPVPVDSLTLTTKTDIIRIHGRPVRIWPAQDPRFGRVYSMAFLFIDHTGGKIQGIIPVPDYQRLSNIFSEENICEISRFTVEGSTLDYQVVKHPFILSLTRQTVVTALQPDSYDIPTKHFDFSSFDDLGVRITHLKAVTGFSDIIENNTGALPSRVQAMYLTDNRGKTVELALWGDYITQFNIPELFEKSKQGPIIIACNSVQLKYWRGIYGLKTYSGTRFYMDPSIKEIADYLAATPYDGNPITLHATSETYNIHLATSSALQRSAPIKLTIAQLNALYLDAYNENHYQCAAIIMNVNNRFDWYYESCPECHRKLSQNATGIWCGNCNVRRTNGLPWYKIRVQAVDQTGSAQFVLLGRLGEAAVGMTAQALVAVQQQNNNVPDQLMAIVGKKYLFTVAGKQRVSHQENRPYTVVSMLEVPPEMLPLLPQPILDHEVADLLSHESPFTVLADLHTPAHPSAATSSSSHMLAQNLLTYHTPQGSTEASDNDQKQVHMKRPLADEEDGCEVPAKNVKRKLEFDTIAPDSTLR
ncbi:hypothetical protein LUZ61_000247 [Rhynchospora tenuis]|uniref:Replication factor A C-terminal domain-containing protein n=1 Tax=Rhynchospora tenuis TaxID=198213 RepID=A0AAD5ZES7_9POAL|nr:hypothetical protein LUZ61_000247 [Rhynchospora tenuis]